MESKTKKMIIIGSLIFLAVVIATLSISLPITLKNHEEKTNSTSSSSTTTTPPSKSGNSTSITVTTEPAQPRNTGTTNVQSTMDDTEPLIAMTSSQEGSSVSPDLIPGPIDPFFIPSTNNLTDRAGMASSESKSTTK